MLFHFGIEHHVTRDGSIKGLLANLGSIRFKPIEVTAIVHTPGKGHNGRFSAQYLVIKPVAHLLYIITANTYVEKSNTGIWKMRHVIQPDVGMVMAAIGNTV